MKVTNSPNNASNGGNGDAKDSQPSEVYENLDPGLWSKTDEETGESEIFFSQQLPEEIRPDSTDKNEDDSPNPKRN